MASLMNLPILTGFVLIFFLTPDDTYLPCYFHCENSRWQFVKCGHMYTFSDTTFIRPTFVRRTFVQTTFIRPMFVRPTLSNWCLYDSPTTAFVWPCDVTPFVQPIHLIQCLSDCNICPTAGLNRWEWGHWGEPHPLR